MTLDKTNKTGPMPHRSLSLGANNANDAWRLYFGEAIWNDVEIILSHRDTIFAEAERTLPVDSLENLEAAYAALETKRDKVITARPGSFPAKERADLAGSVSFPYAVAARDEPEAWRMLFSQKMKTEIAQLILIGGDVARALLDDVPARAEIMGTFASLAATEQRIAAASAPSQNRTLSL